MRGRVGVFFDWWTGELAALMPGRGAAAGRRGLPAVRLDLRDGEIQASHVTDRREVELGRFPRPLAGNEVLQLPPGAGPRETRCEVRLPEGQALVRTLTLPAATEENLHQVLAFEVERQTPFRTDEVYFHYRVVARDNREHTVAVELRVAPRKPVDEVLGLLPGWELDCDRERSAGEDADGRVTLPFASRRASPAGPRRLRGVLVAVNLVLVCVALAVPVLRQQHSLEVLRERRDSVRARAQSAAEIRDALEVRRAQLGYVARLRGTAPAMVVLLEDLSARLPDTTWLSRMEVKGGRVHLHGQSQTASALVARLEASELFSDARFASPVVQDPRSGAERFHITARVAGADEEP